MHISIPKPSIPKPRFKLHNKTQTDIIYHNLEIFTVHVYQNLTQIYLVYQKLDLYRLPKPRFISNKKNLDLYRIDLYSIPKL